MLAIGTSPTRGRVAAIVFAALLSLTSIAQAAAAKSYETSTLTIDFGGVSVFDPLAGEKLILNGSAVAEFRATVTDAGVDGVRLLLDATDLSAFGESTKEEWHVYSAKMKLDDSVLTEVILLGGRVARLKTGSWLFISFGATVAEDGQVTRAEIACISTVEDDCKPPE